MLFLSIACEWPLKSPIKLGVNRSFTFTGLGRYALARYVVMTADKVLTVFLFTTLFKDEQ